MTTVDFRERDYVSQYAIDKLGLVVHVAGVVADADAPPTIKMTNDETSVVVFNRATVRESLGTYSTTTTGSETSLPGDYTLQFNYTIGGINQVYQTYIIIGVAAPPYDVLTPEMKEIVDSVWIRFSDLFDSPDGGPNLLTYYQAHFGRGRIAQMLKIAVNRLNTVAQPYQTYTLDGVGGAEFPIAQWGSLLESACYVETLRHLVRSYVEQPLFVSGGSAVTRLDRRDYLDRWQSVMRDEEAVLKGQLDTFKIANMGLGRPRVLVSGGVYGRFGPTRIAGSVAARPRYWARFYGSAAPALAFVLTPREILALALSYGAMYVTRYGLRRLRGAPQLASARTLPRQVEA